MDKGAEWWTAAWHRIREEIVAAEVMARHLGWLPETIPPMRPQRYIQLEHWFAGEACAYRAAKRAMPWHLPAIAAAKSERPFRLGALSLEAAAAVLRETAGVADVVVAGPLVLWRADGGSILAAGRWWGACFSLTASDRFQRHVALKVGDALGLGCSDEADHG